MRPAGPPPDRWHLTLLFLGAAPADCVPALVDAAAEAVAGAPAMRLRVAGAGRFGPVRRPQVFWAGLDGDVEPLVELAGRLADGGPGTGPAGRGPPVPAAPDPRPVGAAAAGRRQPARACWPATAARRGR